MNKAIIVGRLGMAPDLKGLANGMVCNFNMATSEKWTDSRGTPQERVEWHRIVVWGKMAEVCNKYLLKGSLALVEGRLQTRSWENGAGEKNYITEVVATRVQFLQDPRKKEEPAEFDEHSEIPF